MLQQHDVDTQVNVLCFILVVKISFLEDLMSRLRYKMRKRSQLIFLVPSFCATNV